MIITPLHVISLPLIPTLNSLSTTTRTAGLTTPTSGYPLHTNLAGFGKIVLRFSLDFEKALGINATTVQGSVVWKHYMLHAEPSMHRVSFLTLARGLPEARDGMPKTR